jgi:hypothetical protein
MRHDLIGYLLDSLEEDERLSIEAARKDTEAAVIIDEQLSLLRRAIQPLEHERQMSAAPVGLADRTLAAVRQTDVPVLTPADEAVVPLRPRVWLDRFIMAAAAVAAVVLVAPLLFEAVQDSRARRAEYNLQRMGEALQGYADSQRVFPSPPSEGPLSRAGLFAPTLVSAQRIKPDDGLLVYPGSALDREGGFRIPSREEVEATIGSEDFDRIMERMSGDYGYTLSHRDAAGVLQPIGDLRRGHHPLMADAPDATGQRSGNHPKGAHHILYEDGRVKTIWIEGDDLDPLHRDDHLYRNHDGKIAAGTDAEDAVIGDSHHQP